MKKHFTLLLAFIMLCAVFAGCNRQDATTAPPIFTLDGDAVSQITVCNLPDANPGFVDAAVLLADRILRTGIVTTHYGTLDNDAPCQIVIADAESASAYLSADIAVSPMQYVIFRNKNRIFVVAYDEMGAELGVQAISDAIYQGGNTELSDLCVGVTTYTYGDNLKPEPDAQYRIMTYNVERVELGGNGRQEYARNCILFYNPDVVGFQEYCVDNNAILTPMLTENGYSMVAEEVVTTEGQAPGADRYSMTNNYTPIAYKTEKFQLVDSGWERIVPANHSSYGWPGYSVTWAVLKDKISGDTFAVTTHHNLASSKDTAVDTRTQALAKVVNLVRNKLVVQYNCPVFCVGDYNTTENKGDYQAMASQSDFQDARYVAERGYSVGNTHGAKGTVTCMGTTENAIDHIFYTGNARVLRHRYGHSTIAALASDHKPVFIDVVVGESSGTINHESAFENLNTMHINISTAD